MKRITDEEFKQSVEELTGKEYTFSEPYLKSNIKLSVTHNVCHHSYKVTPNTFKRGGRCPYCNGNLAKLKTTARFKEEVRESVGNEYTVLGEYINRVTNILIRHNKCGREYKVQPGNFLSSSRCIECYYESLRLTQEQAIAKLQDALGDKYMLEENYTGMYDKLSIRHLKCNHTFKATFNDVEFKHSGCPFCSQSIGEQYVTDYLDNNNIIYSYQKRFQGLQDIKPLSYDFYIPSLNILIEYQGIQHYKPKTFGGISKETAQKNFVKQSYHDKLKKDFAYNNNYLLITVPYTMNTFTKVSEFLSGFISRSKAENP